MIPVKPPAGETAMMTDGSGLLGRLWNLLLIGLGVNPEPLLFFVIASLALACTGYGVFALQGRRTTFRSREWLVLFTFGLVAFLTGYISGNSRSTVTGDLLPALLGGLGALFMLGVVQDRIDRSFLAAAVLGFALFTFMGLNIGAAIRTNTEAAGAAASKTALTDLQSTASRIEAAAARLEAAAKQPTSRQGIDFGGLNTDKFKFGADQFNLPVPPAGKPPAKPDCSKLTDPAQRAAAGCFPIYLIGTGVSPYYEAPEPFYLDRRMFESLLRRLPQVPAE